MSGTVLSLTTSMLLEWHGDGWLREKRRKWVSRSGDGRNKDYAGRLGTRLFGGQSQPRWGEGVELAKSLSPDSVNSGRGVPSLTARMREAQSFLVSFLFPQSPDNSG